MAKPTKKKDTAAKVGNEDAKKRALESTLLQIERITARARSCDLAITRQ